MNPYLYILGTLLFTVYGQIAIKWRMNNLKVVLPESQGEKFLYLVKLVFDPFIFTGFLSAFLASICWMAAMSKIEITKGYPFMSIAPALVFIIGVMFLGETFSWGKIIGLLLIVMGTICTVKL